MVVRISTIVTHANVIRSSGWTPNNSVASRRLRAADNASPMPATIAITRTGAPTPLRALGENAEYADHRQEEPQPGKHHHHHRPEPMARGCVPCHVLERHHVPDAHELLLVHTSDGGTDRRCHALSASRRRSERKIDVVHGVLGHRHVDLNEVL